MAPLVKSRLALLLTGAALLTVAQLWWQHVERKTLITITVQSSKVADRPSPAAAPAEAAAADTAQAKQLHIYRNNRKWLQNRWESDVDMNVDAKTLKSASPLLLHRTKNAIEFSEEKSSKFENSTAADALGGSATGDGADDFSAARASKIEIKAHIAIGGGITSKMLVGVTVTNIFYKFQLFAAFLPSFCRTANASGFRYAFYWAYDHDDPVFRRAELRVAFQTTFRMVLRRLCSSEVAETTTVRLVRCRHAGHPAWAQNDAMTEAYLDGVDYFYRINDDVVLETGNWTETFVDVLASFRPPNVGVIGPQHIGGNLEILTFEFVHRTHFEIFGFYYPRRFGDWCADRWMTLVYRRQASAAETAPATVRSVKAKTVRVRHTMELGRRYDLSFRFYRSLLKELDRQLDESGRVLSRLVCYIEVNHVDVEYRAI